MRPRTIDAVVFDLYETLVTELDPNWTPPTATVAQRLNIPDEAFEAAWRALHARRHAGDLAQYAAVLREIGVAAGRELDESTIAALVEERLSVKARPFEHVDPAIERMLRTLRAAGIALGLVSNCMREEVAAWPSCALAPFFDAAVFSYEAGCTKPDPAIYALACARLGVRPERAVFVGDGNFNELDGAERAGLSPYWATWFLERWPHWKSDGPGREHSASYPRVRRPSELVALLTG